MRDATKGMRTDVQAAAGRFLQGGLVLAVEAAELVVAQAQERRRLALAVAGLRERLEEQSLFEFRDHRRKIDREVGGDSGGRGFVLGSGGFRRAEGRRRAERVEDDFVDHSSLGAADGAFHRVFEFTHVSRPVVGAQGFCRRVAPLRGGGQIQFRAHARREVPGQQVDVPCPALPERGHVEHLEAQAIQQVGLELARLGHRGQVRVGRTDQAHIDLHRLARADPLEAAVFDHAQNFLLHRHRHLANFVEKERAAIRRLEAANPTTGRPGERADLVAEQFALQDRGREGGAVQLDQRPTPTLGKEVDARRREFLAGAAFADQEHGSLDLRHAG